MSADDRAASGAIPQRDALELYLAMLAGCEPASSLLELRWRRPQGGMGRCFHSSRRPGALVETIERIGARSDLYIGAAPRRRRDGTADAVERAWVLWADCDGPASAAALEQFEPAPHFVVRTGSGANCHAYWNLIEPVAGRHVARANRRLAHALGADAQATDPARVLRPPGTHNFKHDPPAEVYCAQLEIPSRAPTAHEVVGRLPDPPAPPRREPLPGDRRPATDDPLLEIAPAVYVEALTGRDIGRDGKCSCPFHDDSTPSLHAYPSPEQGWTCFGCGRGGTIVDFGAALYGIEPRGRGFHEIRDRLEAALRKAAAA